jgi:hypothetical protein
VGRIRTKGALVQTTHRRIEWYIGQHWTGFCFCVFSVSDMEIPFFLSLFIGSLFSVILSFGLSWSSAYLLDVSFSTVRSYYGLEDSPFVCFFCSALSSPVASSFLNTEKFRSSAPSPFHVYFYFCFRYVSFRFRSVREIYM